MPMKTRDLIQEIYFNHQPEEIYSCILNANKHSEFTGAVAQISEELNKPFTCYNGYIHGKNIFLESPFVIIQEWKAQEEFWPDYHYSTAQFKLKSLDGGTHLTFIHKGIPEEHYEQISTGWYEYYWEPLKRYLELKKG